MVRRTQFHQRRLISGATVSYGNLGLAVNELVVQLRLGGLDEVGARGQACARVYAETMRQAGAMSFVDLY